MQNKILLGLTTTRRSDWRGKVKEIKKYKIKEIALFLTGLEKEEREDLYKRLEKITNLSVPHVHLRGDMGISELDYLVEQFDVKAFNIHSENDKYPHPFCGKYAHMIYIENTIVIPTREDLGKYAGICMDFSHWEDFRLKNDIDYINNFEKIIKNNKIGCCHVSAIREEPHNDEDKSLQGVKEYSTHFLSNLKEIDYIKRYTSYLPELISIELENSFEEQLKVKKYLNDLINS